MKAGRILLWLLVITVGGEFGAGLYEARVLVPLWSAAPPASIVAYNLQALRPNPGLNFWIISTPLVGLLGLANVVAAWRSAGPNRKWWLGGATAIALVVVATFIYFVPVLQSFERLREGGTNAIATQAHLWVTLNWLRAMVVLGAWLSLLKAFSGS